MKTAIRGMAALLAILLPGAASASQHHRPRQQAVHRPTQDLSLYSLRARRRAATILQLELLELRKAQLERVRKVIEKKLPIDTLVDPKPAPRMLKT